MKKNLAFVVLAAGALLFSCTVKEEKVALHGDEIKFQSTIGDYAVKATDTAFEKGDKVGVSATAPVSVQNVALTWNGTGFEPATPIYWGADQAKDQKVTFTAYYPYSSAGSSSIQVNADQSTHALYTASDFMVAQVASAPADGAVNLVFDHALSQLLLVVDNQTEETIKEVYVGGVKGRASYSGSAITPTGEEGTIKACPVEYNRKSAWVLVIVPQTANPTLMITTESGKQYTYKTDAPVVFSSSKRRVAQVVINEESVATDFTGEVNNWTDDNDVNFGQGGHSGNEDAEGDGSLEDPFNVAAAFEVTKNLSWTSNTEFEQTEPYYVKGIVSKVQSPYSAKYGNAIFFISDDGSTDGQQFEAYQILYLENQVWVDGFGQIEEGDEVILYGPLMNYQGKQPETVAKKAYVYSINGKTTDDGGEPLTVHAGTAEDPFDIADAIQSVKSGKTGEFYVKGVISAIRFTYSAQYGTATFWMSDDGEANGVSEDLKTTTEPEKDFMCYSLYYFDNKAWVEGNKQIEVGDEVIICGNLTNYNGIYETASKAAYLYSLNGETSDEGSVDPGTDVTPAGTGTATDPFNVAAAIAKAVEAGETATEEEYYIKGIVSKASLSAQYKNADLDLVDVVGGDVFKAFRIKGFEGADITGNEPIKEGDVVVVCGHIVNYKSTTPETTQGGILVLWNDQTSFEGGVDPGTDVTPAGTGTATDPFNVAAAIAKAVEAGETATEEEYYIKGIVSKASLSAQYKNADLDLVDVVGGDVFKAFRIKGFEGADITGNEPIKEGDVVVVCGHIVNYKSTTPETTQGGVLVLWNDQTSFGEIPEPQPKEVIVATVAEFLAAEVSADQWYELTGTVKNIKSNVYGNFDLEDASGSVYVYGLTATQVASNDKSFANLEIAEGDNITIIGLRADYKGTAQVGGPAYLKSKN